MSTILMLCFIVFAAFSWIKAKKVAKHDGVLFPFCQLRRDIMRFLCENVFEKPGTLSREEYQSVMRLLDVLNVAINNYNEHKTVMFNIRKVAKYLKQYRDTVKRATPVNLTDNDEIRAFHMRFIYCFSVAFRAYTPLVRSESMLRLVAFIYRTRLSQYVLVVTKQVHSDWAKYEACIYYREHLSKYVLAVTKQIHSDRAKLDTLDKPAVAKQVHSDRAKLVVVKQALSDCAKYVVWSNYYRANYYRANYYRAKYRDNYPSVVR